MTVFENRQHDTGLDAVTGAFGYSGRAIARVLQEQGRRVRTLTGHPGRAAADSTIETRALDFEDLPGLADSLRGTTTLYNTYWVRFARGRTDHNVAVENSRALFNAARRAGVQRIVHVSITNPSLDSPYPYFRGKALVERALAEAGLPYAVLRPAILFAPTACSSTTSLGCSGTFRSSRWVDAASTASGRSMWTISRNSRW
jgi:NADH dehydrogenase